MQDISATVSTAIRPVTRLRSQQMVLRRVTRIDSGGGWGMHLQITCVAAPVHTLIDSSSSNTKCGTHSFPVSCVDDAGHLNNRINSHQASDTFDITTNGAEVCATRTDSSAGWGMHLEIACVATGKEEGPIVSAPTMNVLIDNSNTKWFAQMMQDIGATASTAI